MAPIRSSLSRSVSKLLGVFRDRDTSLRGSVQISRRPPDVPQEYWEFKVWGGGGGGGGNANNLGGGAAYITGQYQIAPGTDIKLVVGTGSIYPVAINKANYGGGGPKGTTHGYTTGTGGGMSGVFLTSDTVFTSADAPTPAGVISPRASAAPNVQPGATVTNCLIAAAGGGACVGYDLDGHGGHGGITAGGASSNTDPAAGATWAGAGSNTGAGGASDTATPGGLFFGGNSTGGGGGGGGYYGGGGGGNSSEVSGGAGGASYYKTTQPGPPAFLGYNPGSFANSADGIPGDTGAYASNPGYAGNRSDPLNGGNYGSGTTAASGQNGLIAYRRATSYAALPGASWTSVTHVGTDQTINTGPGID